MKVLIPRIIELNQLAIIAGNWLRLLSGSLVLSIALTTSSLGQTPPTPLRPVPLRQENLNPLQFEQPANRSEETPSNNRTVQQKFHAFRLEHAQAEGVSAIVLELLPLDAPSRLAIDAGNNQILVYSDENTLSRIRSIVKILDTQAIAKVRGHQPNDGSSPQNSKPAADAADIGDAESRAGRVQVESLEDDAIVVRGRKEDVDRFLRAVPFAGMRAEFEQADAESREIAERLHNLEKDSSQRVAELEQLRRAVQRAFDARLDLQEMEVDAMRARLETVEQNLRRRAQLREESISKRVDELQLESPTDTSESKPSNVTDAAKTAKNLELPQLVRGTRISDRDSESSAVVQLEIVNRYPTSKGFRTATNYLPNGTIVSAEGLIVVALRQRFRHEPGHAPEWDLKSIEHAFDTVVSIVVVQDNRLGTAKLVASDAAYSLALLKADLTSPFGFIPPAVDAPAIGQRLTSYDRQFTVSDPDYKLEGKDVFAVRTRALNPNPHEMQEAFDGLRLVTGDLRLQGITQGTLTDDPESRSQPSNSVYHVWAIPAQPIITLIDNFRASERSK